MIHLAASFKPLQKWPGADRETKSQAQSGARGVGMGQGRLAKGNVGGCFLSADLGMSVKACFWINQGFAKGVRKWVQGRLGQCLL